MLPVLINTIEKPVEWVSYSHIHIEQGDVVRIHGEVYEVEAVEVHRTIGTGKVANISYTLTRDKGVLYFWNLTHSSSRKDLKSACKVGAITILAPYTCKYCGGRSWLYESDQSPPVDYCHESDHGEPE